MSTFDRSAQALTELIEDQARTTRRGTLLAPPAPDLERIRLTVDHLEREVAKLWPALEALARELARSMEALARVHGRPGE